MRRTGSDSIPRLRGGARKAPRRASYSSRNAVATGSRAARSAGKQAADQADGQRDHDSRHQQRRGHLEGEGDLAEALPVERRGLEAVEAEVGHGPADHGAEQGDHQRFAEDREDDRAAPEAERPQGGDLAGARRHRVVHRVERAEDGAERHQHGDEAAEAADQQGQGLGLVGVVLALAHHLDVQPRVGRQGVLEAGERRGRLQQGMHRLEGVAAPVGRLQDAGVAPDLRLGEAAAVAEDAHHGPLVLAPAQGAAEVEPGELLRRAAPHDDLVPPRLELAAGEDLEALAHHEGRRLHARAAARWRPCRSSAWGGRPPRTARPRTAVPPPCGPRRERRR